MMLYFDEVVIFAEGTRAIEDAVAVTQGNLSFMQKPSPRDAQYEAAGQGSFTVWDISFDYSPGKLLCDGKETDISKSALIVRRDGTIVSAYLLTLLAK